ncbi:hypothetical protein IWW36_003819, partial [Coemansia brasiliensis]
MSNGRKQQYLELESNRSVSTNMNGQEREGIFARGVGFEDQNISDSNDGGKQRQSMFGTLRNAIAGRPSMGAGEKLAAIKEKPRQSMGGTGGEGNMEKGNHEHIEAVEITRKRKLWVLFTWMATFWAPSPLLAWCGRMKRPDVRMAWREKVAICAIVLLLWFVLLFIIIGLGLILCPKQNVWTMDDITNINEPKKS